MKVRPWKVLDTYSLRLSLRSWWRGPRHRQTIIIIIHPDTRTQETTKQNVCVSLVTGGSTWYVQSQWSGSLSVWYITMVTYVETHPAPKKDPVDLGPPGTACRERNWLMRCREVPVESSCQPSQKQLLNVKVSCSIPASVLWSGLVQFRNTSSCSAAVSSFQMGLQLFIGPGNLFRNGWTIKLNINIKLLHLNKSWELIAP